MNSFTVPFQAPAEEEAQPIDQIAYCCLVAPGVLSLGMADFVAQVNQDKMSASLSGLLMWDGRLMIHWIEGERATLDALWDDIQNDQRQHCLVPLLHKRDVKKRLFEQWQMQPASRNEMMVIVREAREQASRELQPETQSWQYPMSTLSILLNPDLSPFYAQSSRSAEPAHQGQSQPPLMPDFVQHETRRA